MSKINKIITVLIVVGIGLGIAFGGAYSDKKIFGATNFDRLVLGEGNYGEDPNITADITGQNDEYWTNVTNGRWDAGSADIYTSGSISIAGITMTGALATVTNITMTGDLLGADSIKGRTLYLTEDIANVSEITIDTGAVGVITNLTITGTILTPTNITMTGDLLGADSIKGRTLYLTEDIANVTDIAMAGAITGLTNLTMTGSIDADADVGGLDSFGVSWAGNNQETADTVTITGAGATDIFVVSINDPTPVAADLLSWKAITNALIVYRVDTTTAGLPYSYIRIK